MQNREQYTRLTRNAREQRSSLRCYDTLDMARHRRGEQLPVCFSNETSGETLNVSTQSEQLESCAKKCSERMLWSQRIREPEMVLIEQ